MKLLSLHLHPVKSVVDVDTLDITPRGPRGDRRWLVVDADADHCFVTARQLPEMVLIKAALDDDGLQLSAPGMATLAVAVPPVDAARVRVQIWKDEVDAITAGDCANAWLSEYLKRPVQLVHMDTRTQRPIDTAYGQPDDEVSFADGYPISAISQTALDALNAKLSSPITMARFRPNLVIADCAAHAEDEWHRVRIGNLVFDVVKHCTRCVFTTIDPITGQRDAGGEPLRTLNTYRRAGARIRFGMHLIPRSTGRLQVGDAVEVLA